MRQQQHRPLHSGTNTFHNKPDEVDGHTGRKTLSTPRRKFIFSVSNIDRQRATHTDDKYLATTIMDFVAAVINNSIQQLLTLFVVASYETM